MPVIIDHALSVTNDLTINDDVWQSIVGGPQTVLGLGFVVQIQGYALNLDPEDRIRFVVDGTEVVKGSPSAPLMYNVLMSVGTHTVDFQAMSHEETEVVGPRGLTIIDTGVLL